MREIKFRAWMPKEQKWYKGGAIHLTTMIGNQFGLSEANSKIIELQQFTGLTDCHGTKIYEGDIVEYSSLSLPPVYPLKRVTGTGIEAILQHSHSVIRWSAEEAGFVFGQTNSPLGFMIDDGVFDGEVIGNIYQDPRLLGEEDGE